MSLIVPTTIESLAVPPRRRPSRSEDEIAIRALVEQWSRHRWPSARLVHELVVGRGDNRADMAAVSANHLVAIEIKGPYDGTGRLFDQVCMFRLAAPELWVVCAACHAGDAELIRWLIPSVGVVIVGEPGCTKVTAQSSFSVRHEAVPIAPHPKSMLSLLWVDELRREAEQFRLVQGRGKLSHARLVELMLRLDPPEQIEAVCRQLRGRNAFWRADPVASAA